MFYRDISIYNENEVCIWSRQQLFAELKSVLLEGTAPMGTLSESIPIHNCWQTISLAPSFLLMMCEKQTYGNSDIILIFFCRDFTLIWRKNIVNFCMVYLILVRNMNFFFLSVFSVFSLPLYNCKFSDRKITLGQHWINSISALN